MHHSVLSTLLLSHQKVVHRKYVYRWNSFIFLHLSVSDRFTRAAWNLSTGQQDRYSASIPLKVVNRRLSLTMKLCSLYFLCIFHNREKYRVSPWPLLYPSWVCVSITCSVSHVSAHVGVSVLGSGHERLIDCSLKAWTLRYRQKLVSDQRSAAFHWNKVFFAYSFLILKMSKLYIYTIRYYTSLCFIKSKTFSESC